MNPNNGTLMVAEHKPSAGNERILSGEQIISLGLAVDDQKAALGSSKKVMLHIDAIELVHMGQGGFIYRLLLSNPTHLQVDQPLTLTAGRAHSSQPTQASILHVKDQQIVIFCRSALSEDIRLVQAKFDPGFILDALREFIEYKNNAPSGLAHQLARRSIPTAHATAMRTSVQGLNDQQLEGLRKMLTGPMHFLWGPPGTGKTRTVGAAVAEWLRDNKSVLILSTSNVAVDIAFKATVRHMAKDQSDKLLRLGNTADPELFDFTIAGKAMRNCTLVPGGSATVTDVQQELKKIMERLLATCRHQTGSSGSNASELERLSLEKAKLEAELSHYNAAIDKHAQVILDGSRVVACTLAKLVLEKRLHGRSFDAVVVDEASMVPLAYAIAASMVAKGILVYAGDPCQLPPILSDSNSSDARLWFGENVYSWLDIEDRYKDARRDAISLLTKQYRMTKQIGTFVSELTYQSSLEHMRGEDGLPVEFIELPEEWCRTYYSVAEKSYYHPGTIALIHEILPSLGPNKEQVLLLTPFRPQQALMAATVSDLTSSQKMSETAVSCSTIHRAQGSEACAVILDLTAHSPDSVPAFFRAADSRNLLNVALSRAKNQLIVLGNQKLLSRLSDQGGDHWTRFRTLLKSHANVYNAADILPEPQPFADLLPMTEHDQTPSIGMPAIAAVGNHPAVDRFIEFLQRVHASRKLLVLPKNSDTRGTEEGSIIVRHDDGGRCPSLLVAASYVFLPLNGGWIATKSPISRVIWRVGFSHLADGEVNPSDEQIFFCRICHVGYLTIESTGDGWFLRCNRWPDCRCQRPLSLPEAKLKVRMNDMRCDKGHPLTARSSHGDLFIGCENYPSCDYKRPLSILRGS